MKKKTEYLLETINKNVIVLKGDKAFRWTSVDWHNNDVINVLVDVTNMITPEEWHAMSHVHPITYGQACVYVFLGQLPKGIVE